jgi:hypothetical protein
LEASTASLRGVPPPGDTVLRGIQLLSESAFYESGQAATHFLNYRSPYFTELAQAEVFSTHLEVEESRIEVNLRQPRLVSQKVESIQDKNVVSVTFELGTTVPSPLRVGC